MPRAIWTGAISFGLVSVPVRLYSAVSSKTVRFHQLNRATGARINMRRVDASTGEEVPYEDIVKGYELTPDRYVVVDPSELDALDPVATHTIDIQDFVDLSEIDPIYYDHPYYLAPAAGGAKPYRLLVDAMRETGKVGIATVVIRSKEQLVALRPMDNGVLGMTTMVFADEVVDPKVLDDLPGEIEVSQRELDVAQQLVESLTAPFDPGRYEDTYRARVLELIERKANGEEVAAAPAPEERAPVPDLMAALKASLDAARAGNTAPKRKPAAKKRAAAAKAKTATKTPAGRRRA